MYDWIKSKERPSLPFYLRDKQGLILPNSPSVLLGQGLPEDKVELLFEAHHGDAILLRIQFKSQLWESWEEPYLSTSATYNIVSSLSNLDQKQFTLFWNNATLPCNAMVTLASVVGSVLPEPVLLQVKEGPTIRILFPDKSTPPMIFNEPADTPLSHLFSLIANNLSSPLLFYLSEDAVLLFFSDNETPLSHFIHNNSNTVELYFIPTDSVIKVEAPDPYEEDRIKCFGFPKDYTLGAVWKSLELYFPKMVAFPSSAGIVRRSQDLSVLPNLDTTLLASLLEESENSLTVPVTLTSKDDVIFIELQVEDALQCLCTYPDVALGDLLYFALEDKMEFYNFVGPDQIELEQDGPVLQASTYDYVYLIRETHCDDECIRIRATQALSFTVQYDGEVYSLPYQEESQLTKSGLLAILAENFPAIADSSDWTFCLNGIVSITFFHFFIFFVDYYLVYLFVNTNIIFFEL